jgi:hypothetical protein
MDPHPIDNRMAGLECPACGWPAAAGNGVLTACTHCGCWQVVAVEIPSDDAVLDVLSAAALPLEDLRRFLNGGAA